MRLLTMQQHQCLACSHVAVPLAVTMNAVSVPLIPEERKAGLHFILNHDHAMLCVLEKAKSNMDSSACPQQQVAPPASSSLYTDHDVTW